jgi:hypothetical protein
MFTLNYVDRFGRLQTAQGVWELRINKKTNEPEMVLVREYEDKNKGTIERAFVASFAVAEKRAFIESFKAPDADTYEAKRAAAKAEKKEEKKAEKKAEVKKEEPKPIEKPAAKKSGKATPPKTTEALDLDDDLENYISSIVKQALKKYSK